MPTPVTRITASRSPLRGIMSAMAFRLLAYLLALWFAAACGDGGSGPAAGNARAPLPQLGAGTYKGFVGGLYPAGSNLEPAAHAAAGLSRAGAVIPRDTAGNPDPAGKVVLLSIGMSNTSQEFCSAGSTTTGCTAGSFMGQAAADPAVNHDTMVSERRSRRADGPNVGCRHRRQLR